MPAIIDMQLLLSFAMTVVVIIVVPGPSAMFIVGRALAVGRPAAIAAAAGNTVGSIVQGVLAVFGFGAVVGNTPMLYNAIRLGGAVYLMKLGISMLRNREFSTAADNPSPSGSGRQLEARRGFVVGATNPKMMLFFAAVLPQFIDRSRGYVVVQMLVLLAVYSVLSLAGDTSWGLAGGSLRSWTASSPRRIERLIGGGGLCIIVVGVALALSHSVG